MRDLCQASIDTVRAAEAKRRVRISDQFCCRKCIKGSMNLLYQVKLIFRAIMSEDRPLNSGRITTHGYKSLERMIDSMASSEEHLKGA